MSFPSKPAFRVVHFEPLRQQIIQKKGNGAPGEIRTPDPLLRRQTLYPTELRARRAQLIHCTALAACFATSDWAGSLSLFPILVATQREIVWELLLRTGERSRAKIGLTVPTTQASVQTSQPDSSSRVRKVCRGECRTDGRQRWKTQAAVANGGAARQSSAYYPVIHPKAHQVFP